MDVYTEPPTTCYVLGKLFKFPREGGDILAISVPNSFALLLSAMYAILTVYLSTALWNVLLHIVMLTAKQRRGLSWNLVLSIYWNSAEPMAAFWNLSTTVNRLLRRDVSSRKDPSLWLGIQLTILSLMIAVGSVAGGILVPSQLVVGRVAPVNTDSIYIASPTHLSLGTSLRYGMIDNPAAIRALGSAEASKVTLRNRVNVLQERTSASTEEKPDFSINYSYNLTGVELGLPSSFALFHSVTGKCWTEYGWLHHEPRNATIGRMDYYDLWDLKNNKSQMFVYGKNSLLVNNQLNIMTSIHPDHVVHPPSNISYAIGYQTAHMASTTESNDAMYQTELMPSSYALRNIFPFRVRAERPVLSCWQSSTFCIHGQCSSLLDVAQKNPPVLPPATILTLARLNNPMIISLANSMGPSSLMSFYGPNPGTKLDAGSSSTFADFERMMMGAYLLSRNIFRDSALTAPVEGFKNLILNAKNQPLRGAGDFVIESGLVTTLSFWWLVSLPAAAVILCLVYAVLGGLVRSVGEGKLKVRGEQRERMVGLSMGQLYRRASWRGEEVWSKRFMHRMIPVPVDEKEELDWELGEGKWSRDLEEQGTDDKL